MKMAANKWMFALVLLPAMAFSQTQDSTFMINKKRLRVLTIGGTVAYGVTLVGLSQLWYSDAERQAFRFFQRQWRMEADRQVRSFLFQLLF